MKNKSEKKSRHDIFSRLLLIFAILILSVASSCNKKDNGGTHYFKTSLIYNDTNLPIITLPTAGDKSTKYIIDTGSGRTIVDRKFYKEHPDHFTITNKIMFNAFTANGNLVDSAYIATSMIDSLRTEVIIMNIDEIKRNTYTATGQIINGIIGSDYMSRHGAIIDFEEKSFTINKKR